MVNFSLRKIASALLAACVVAAGIVIPVLTLPEAFVASAATGDPTSTLNVSVTSSSNKPVDGAEVSVTCTLPDNGGGDSDGSDIEWESFVSTASIGASNSAQDTTKNGVATFTEVPEGATCTVTVKSCGDPVSQTVAITPGENNLSVPLACEVDSSSPGGTTLPVAPIPAEPSGKLTINARTPDGEPVPGIPFSVTCEAKASNNAGGTQPPDQPTPPSDPSDGSAGTGTDNGDGSDDNALDWESFVSSAVIGSDKTADVVTEENGSVEVTGIPVGENGHTCTVMVKNLSESCAITPPIATADILPTALEATADFEVACRHSVSLVKVDADSGEKLEGFTFKLAGNEQSFEATSNDEGYVHFGPLDAGEYTLSEISVPENSVYELSTETRSVTVSAKPGVPIELGDFVNRKILGSVVVKKTGEKPFLEGSDHPIAGAEFQVFKSVDGQVGDPVGEPVVTNGDGLATFDNLLKGSYIVKEVKPASDQYRSSDEKREFTIETQAQRVDLTDNPVINKLKRAGFAFTKLKENSTTPELEEPLPGAEFTLSSEDGNVRQTVLSAADGTVKFENLPLGTYTVKETAPPEGWTYLAGGEQTFQVTLTEDGQFREDVDPVYNGRIFGSVHLRKVTDSNIPLAAARFVLKDLQGNIVQEHDSKVEGNPVLDGHVFFQNIPFGKYTLEEVEAPQGYDRDSQVHEINIDSPYKNIDLGDVKNLQKKGSVTLTKVDASNHSPLEGVEFTLLRKETGESFVSSSGADGRVTFGSLPWGEYILTETQPREGYAADSTARNITISADNLIVSLGLIENRPEPKPEPQPEPKPDQEAHGK